MAMQMMDHKIHSVIITLQNWLHCLITLDFFKDISRGDFDIEPTEPENNADRELDESKEFFELVQQFMAEYTASAKVCQFNIVI